MPRDTGASFIQTVTKRAQQTPGPNFYKESKLASKIGWVTTNGQFHMGSARRTFTDDAVRHSKLIPAPSAYDKGNKSRFRIPMGIMDKAESIDFLTQIQSKEKKRPGPTSYNPKPMLKRAAAAKLYTPINPKTAGWRSVKTGLPGPGSHDMPTQKIKTKPRVVSAYLGAEKGSRVYERETYATLVSNSKKFVPGVGNYNKE